MSIEPDTTSTTSGLSFEQVIDAAGVTDAPGLAQDLAMVLGLQVDTVRFTRVILPLERALGWRCDPESYLLDGDEDGYERVVAMADDLNAGQQLPPIIIGYLPGTDSLQILDGMHRLSASFAAGLECIEAYEARSA